MANEFSPLTEEQVREVASKIKEIAELGELTNLLNWTSELIRDDQYAPRSLVRIFRQAAEQVEDL